MCHNTGNLFLAQHLLNPDHAEDLRLLRIFVLRSSMIMCPACLQTGQGDEISDPEGSVTSVFAGLGIEALHSASI